jgi:hypothetical protein
VSRLVRESASRITQDDLLHFAIEWVKENRGDGPGFVPEVAAVLEMLKGEFLRPASLVESYEESVRIAAANAGEMACAHGKVPL